MIVSPAVPTASLIDPLAVALRRHNHGPIDPRAFERVTLTVKETTTEAWMYLAGAANRLAASAPRTRPRRPPEDHRLQRGRSGPRRPGPRQQDHPKPLTAPRPSRFGESWACLYAISAHLQVPCLRNVNSRCPLLAHSDFGLTVNVFGSIYLITYFVYTEIVDYVPVLSAFAGGLVGAGSAFLLEWQRRRHERRVRFLDRKRDSYELFLAALINTDATMRALGQAEGTPLDRDRARSAFDSHSLLVLRYRVHLIGQESVVRVADEVYYKLQAVREAMIEVNLPVGVRESEEWQSVHKPYRDALQDLISVMQVDIKRAI